MHDPLTGLGDQAAFQDALAAARVHAEIAVLLVAPDDEDAADRTLVAISAALSSVLRGGDDLFRVAPDAFAVVLKLVGDDPAIQAVEAARRLQDAVAATAGTTVSVSAVVPLAGDDGDAVLARGGRALQLA